MYVAQHTCGENNSQEMNNQQKVNLALGNDFIPFLAAKEMPLSLC